MKRYQPKLFAVIAAILIAIQILNACAPATSTSGAPSVSTQPPTSPTEGIPQTGATEAPTMAPTEAPTNAEMTDPLVFQQAMRKLWEDHITWTRVYIILAAHRQADGRRG